MADKKRELVIIAITEHQPMGDDLESQQAVDTTCTTDLSAQLSVETGERFEVLRRDWRL